MIKHKLFLAILSSLLALAMVSATQQPKPATRTIQVTQQHTKKEPSKTKTPIKDTALPTSPTIPRPKPTVPIKVTSNVLTKINVYRSSIGLSQLAESADLDAISQAHTERMACCIGHVHSGYPYEITGWNQGYADSETIVVQMWIASPAHNHIIVGNYTYFGVGEINNNGTYWFTVQFK